MLSPKTELPGSGNNGAGLENKIELNEKLAADKGMIQELLAQMQELRKEYTIDQTNGTFSVRSHSHYDKYMLTLVSKHCHSGE